MDKFLNIQYRKRTIEFFRAFFVSLCNGRTSLDDYLT